MDLSARICWQVLSILLGMFVVVCIDLRFFMIWLSAEIMTRIVLSNSFLVSGRLSVGCGSKVMRSIIIFYLVKLVSVWLSSSLSGILTLK